MVSSDELTDKDNETDNTNYDSETYAPKKHTNTNKIRKRKRRVRLNSSKYILSIDHIEEHIQCEQSIKALRSKLNDKIIGYRCKWSECEFASRIQRKVESHIRAKHTNYRPINCDECESCFVDTSGLKAHKHVVHSKHRFVCDYSNCEYVGKTLDQLKSHKVSHLELKPFLCEWPDCGHRSAKKCRIMEHMRRIHLKDDTRLSCDWPGCDSVFTTRRGKTAHNRLHLNVKPYSCVWPGCDYRTGDWSHLRRHKKKHNKSMDGANTEERKFACSWPECDRKFVTKWNLKTHIRVHSGERPYECEWPQCERRFSEKGNMIKHLNTHTIKKKSKLK